MNTCDTFRKWITMRMRIRSELRARCHVNKESCRFLTNLRGGWLQAQSTLHPPIVIPWGSWGRNTSFMTEEVKLRVVERNELKGLQEHLQTYLPESVTAYNILVMMQAGLLPSTKALVPALPNDPNVVILSYPEWQRYPVQEPTYIICCIGSDLELLEKCIKTLDWRERFTFSVLPHRYWDIVTKVGREKCASPLMEGPDAILELICDRHLALKWNERIPDDLEIKKLSVEHADLVSNDQMNGKHSKTFKYDIFLPLLDGAVLIALSNA
ncbi:unnamed protein product [Darwinula stevensoni]|uniref:Uncharacterized protein n=1 Tax=Darwinula stevensoni TaxID=69355 RepID=A0A7R9ADA7_9CRUS|nr:unnamed protein product [Darwinula stevensoni]CAG0901137.1 unnamed protein product [Darwinula stevensoni]